MRHSVACPKAHRVYLSSEVHLDGGIDRGDLRILSDHRRIVDPRNVAEVDERIVVHKVVELLRAEHKARRKPAGLVELCSRS